MAPFFTSDPMITQNIGTSKKEEPMPLAQMEI